MVNFATSNSALCDSNKNNNNDNSNTQFALMDSAMMISYISACQHMSKADGSSHTFDNASVFFIVLFKMDYSLLVIICCAIILMPIE